MGNYDLNSSSWILSASQTRKNLPVWNIPFFKPIGFLGLHCLIHKALHPLEIALINSVCLVPNKLVLLPFPLPLFFPSWITELSLLVLSSVLLFLVFNQPQRLFANSDSPYFHISCVVSSPDLCIIFFHQPLLSSSALSSIFLSMDTSKDMNPATTH